MRSLNSCTVVIRDNTAPEENRRNNLPIYIMSRRCVRLVNVTVKLNAACPKGRCNQFQLLTTAVIYWAIALFSSFLLLSERYTRDTSEWRGERDTGREREG